jgi:Icc-related predicted phosphoesterase
MFSQSQGLSFIFAHILLWLNHHIQSSFCFTRIEAFRSSSLGSFSADVPWHKPRLLHQLKDTAIFDIFGSDQDDSYCIDADTFQQPLPAENVEFPPISVAVVIDFENVRGSNGFFFAHDTILSLIGEWGSTEQSSNHVFSSQQLFLVVDHGNTPTSFWIPYNATRSCTGDVDSCKNGYAVIFSGLNCKADDTIVHDVLPYIFSSFASASISHQSSQNCVVQIVTADRLLIQRCHRVLRDYNHQSGFRVKPRSTKKSMLSATFDIDGALNPSVIELEIVSPKVFLSQLEKFYQSSDSTDGNDNMEDTEKILSNEKIFSKKSINVSKHRHHRKKSTPVFKKETTEDRIVLAEALRIKFEQYAQNGSVSANMLEKNYTIGRKVLSLSKAYVYHMAKKLEASKDKSLPLLPGMKCSSLLRLVVISDTHGFESQLEVPLPDGDVLLHLGDFAKDNGILNRISNSKKRVKSHHSRHDGSQLASFDEWLAQQPHPLKIVLRGNHDPKSMAFLNSGATYITQPSSMDIAGFKFAFAPYQTVSKKGSQHKAFLPKTGCDVIVSHVPPYSILDCCYTGKSAGSKTLLKNVQHMNGNDGPPILWLCGHIHEGRGIAKDVLLCIKTSKMPDSGMTIVNAACANLGHARYLEYGPVLLELSSSQKHGSNMNRKKAKVLEMDGQHEFLNSRHPYFFQRQVEQKTSSLLLAVDLGLRTGISLFDTLTGQLLRFEHFDYESIDALEHGARNIIQTWEVDLNSQTTTKDISMCKARTAGNCYRVSHVAIEGSDPSLLDAWNRAIGSKNDNMGIRVLLVTPNEWRTDLLTSIERQSGESAKKASQRISQLIIKKQPKFAVHGTESVSAAPHKPQINGVHVVQESANQSADLQAQPPTVDVAESILLGYHVCRRLGCCPTELLTVNT